MPQLNDFQNFRNIVFHDNYCNVPNRFKHTIFNENPMKSNIIDVFQAYKVMLQVLEAFRYVFKGCDIMPDCVPMLIDFNKGPVYYEKIDKLYNDLLVPYFKTILMKHMLATDFDFEYKKFNVETTEVLQEMDVRPLIKVMPNIENIKLNQQETNLYKYYIDDFTQNVIMSKDLFGIPNWHRNK